MSHNLSCISVDNKNESKSKVTAASHNLQLSSSSNAIQFQLMSPCRRHTTFFFFYIFVIKSKFVVFIHGLNISIMVRYIIMIKDKSKMTIFFIGLIWINLVLSHHMTSAMLMHWQHRWLTGKMVNWYNPAFAMSWKFRIKIEYCCMLCHVTILVTYECEINQRDALHFNCSILCFSVSREHNTCAQFLQWKLMVTSCAKLDE